MGSSRSFWWLPLGSGILAAAQPVSGQVMCGSWEIPPQLPGTVSALARFQDGIYVAGGFSGPSGSYITRFTGSGYAPLPQQLSSYVTALCVFDDGSGPALFAGGQQWNFPPFTTHRRVIRWDGQSWTGTGWPAFSTAMDVSNFAAFDDGQGTRLYAAADHVHRWSGTTWSVVPGSPSSVYALAVFDDGGGPALYAGGTFYTAGGNLAKSLARWRSGEWSEVGGGVHLSNAPGEITCLEVLDVGHGARLFVGGMFDRVGETHALAVASWDGQSWERYPFNGYPLFFVSTPAVKSFAVLRETDPPLLLIGAVGISSVGGQLAGGLLIWDGERWHGAGAPAASGVYTLLPSESPGNPRVLVGGSMSGGTVLAEWTPAPFCYANCDCSITAPQLNVADFTCFLQRFAAGNMGANCDASTVPPLLNVADFSCFLQRFAAGCP